MKSQLANRLALMFSAGALSLTAVAAQAQEISPPEPRPASSTTRAQVLTDLADYRAAGLAQAWRGENTPDVNSNAYRAGQQRYQHTAAQPVSRADVQRDLAAWHDAGLAQAWQGEITPDLGSQAYQAREQQYEAARG